MDFSPVASILPPSRSSNFLFGFLPTKEEEWDDDNDEIEEDGKFVVDKKRLLLLLLFDLRCFRRWVETFMIFLHNWPRGLVH